MEKYRGVKVNAELFQEFSPLLPNKEVIRRSCAYCGGDMILFLYDEQGNRKTRFPRYHNGHCYEMGLIDRVVDKAEKEKEKRVA